MQKSGEDRSKGGGWGRRKFSEGEGKGNIQKTVDNVGVGISLDVTLVTEPNFGAVSDRDWNTTTSYLSHTLQNSGRPNNNNNTKKNTT